MSRTGIAPVAQGVEFAALQADGSRANWPQNLGLHLDRRRSPLGRNEYGPSRNFDSLAKADMYGLRRLISRALAPPNTTRCGCSRTPSRWARSSPADRVGVRLSPRSCRSGR